ncbi:hypothetical protein [Actinomadura sp. NTSP31]|uniref:hypothetical protein n=1 Tax=Actinomadura sp. NTSP31 TaxID=1735447 RepID=UPI0035BEDF12
MMILRRTVLLITNWGRDRVTEQNTEFEIGVETYVPAGNPPGWRRVAAEVRRAVRRGAPSAVYPARELMGVLTRLALFADAEGYPLQAELWLTREYIERFAAVGCCDLSQATRANYRSKLLRLREALLGGDCLTGRPAQLPGSGANPPYSIIEQAQLYTWVAGQPTQELRRGLTVLLAAGLGCGIDSTEIARLRIGDVRSSGPARRLPEPATAVDGGNEGPATGRDRGQDTSQDTAQRRTPDQVQANGDRPDHADHADHADDEGAVRLAVRGRRARIVVCRRPWERVLDDLAGQAGRDHGDDAYLFRPGVANRGGNLVTNFVARAHPAPATPAFKTGRLRASWLVSLISEGVPLQALVAAAGLQTLHGLSRIMPHLPAVPADTAATILRGVR